jgi:hypothetical protein
MKTTLTLLVATTALTAALGLPALAAMRMGDGAQSSLAVALDDMAQTAPLIRISDDDGTDDDSDNDGGDDGAEDDRDGGGASSGDDKGGDRTESGSDDDDDDDAGCNRATDATCLDRLGSPAPAGTVAPPRNGLFGNGKPPVAVTN